MKKSFKLILFTGVILTITVVYGLVGCASTTTSAETTSAETTSAETTSAETTSAETTSAEKVKIIYTSWRVEDVDPINRILAVFEEKYPNIDVEFKPVAQHEYAIQLATVLEAGTNEADIMAMDSYNTARQIYDGGYLVELNDLVPELKNFPSNALEAWGTKEGIVYGAPWNAVSAGIYYNKEIFNKYGLSEPKTWSEFINIMDVLKNNGEPVVATGYANGSNMSSLHFSNYGATFYKGEYSRKKVVAGEMKITDPLIVDAFRSVQKVAEYKAPGTEAMDYLDALTLFVSGKAAIRFDGSWAAQVYESQGINFDYDFFAPPPINEGDKIIYQWHPDHGLGIYKNTKHLDECVTFIRWLMTPEGAQVMLDNLPGFFTYVPGDYKLATELAQKQFNLRDTSELTMRFGKEAISDQEPSADTLLQDALYSLCAFEITPEEAAQQVQTGLESWYEPFQHFKQ